MILIRPKKSTTRYGFTIPDRWRWRPISSVINATPDTVVTRMAEVTDHAWPNKAKHEEFGKAERKPMIMMADWLREAQLFPKVPSDRGLVNKTEE